MSESQFSDALSSSYYDGEVENFVYPSDNTELLTPNLAGSQQTVNSLDPEFLRPAPRPIIPSCLTRVGRGKSKAYVLYESIVHTEWVDWWLETDCGRISKIKWDSKHSAEVWAIAPKVMCKRCDQILEHLYHLRLGRQGTLTMHRTTTMLRHLKTEAYITKFIRSDFTTELLRTRDITSYYTFKMYNLLFDYIDAATSRLAKKRAKLKDYYSQTDNIPSDLYAVASMLSLVNKFAFFQLENWEASLLSQTPSRKRSRLNIILNKSICLTTLPKDEVIEYLDSAEDKEDDPEYLEFDLISDNEEDGINREENEANGDD
ncbi:hypothetical protein F1880_007972 [Penicillium rolfsii]|nr:hypothetical protein F1880_007972 [Penicillium rolfsii]